MTLIPAVRAKVSPSCFVSSMKKKRCSLLLDGTPRSRLIVDLDADGSPIGRDARRCDYLFFAEGQLRVDLVGCEKAEPAWVAPVEFKGAAPKASKIVRQLQAGADKAHSLASKAAVDRFVPIAVAKRWPRAERESLKRRQVMFRGRWRRVQLRHCGSRLADALAELDS